MAFVAMLAAAAYGLEENAGSERCALRPLSVHAYIETEATHYAAAMNVLLAYYKRMDDWQDDHNARALTKSRRLEAFLPSIRERWPAQCESVQSCLAALARMEHENELNPDIPANCFGEMLGSVLDWRGGEARGGEAHGCEARGGVVHGGETRVGEANGGEASGGVAHCAGSAAGALRKIGESLGRFVYLMDAFIDLRADIRKERYNPLIAQTGGDCLPMLSLMIGECAQELEKLPLARDIGIFRNIVYSGVWTRYRMRKALNDRAFWRKRF